MGKKKRRRERIIEKRRGETMRRTSVKKEGKGLHDKKRSSLM